MLQVSKAAMPAEFDTLVIIPGLRAIAEMIGKETAGKRYARTAGRRHATISAQPSAIPSDRFPPYWRSAIPLLMTAYNEISGYTCFRIHPVTGAASADHFVAKSTNWRKVYTWSNYRLCCARMNSRKNDFTDVLDPFDVLVDSFQLELLAFQVKPNPLLVDDDKLKVNDSIRRLGLNEFCSQREEDAEAYWAGDLSLSVLKRESPFVAYELHRQGRLNEGDVW
ncbi:hypothetical protein NOJ28_04205 [Neorhizobium galegae]|uniref:hypothetical protein n=1 Tax=Neorhizobium galegae TaxID=399 RepID=UPI0021060BEF|nr:hypothetical protein [Neorhizobium galegae]MCQ1764725.1 hypothetical protein [Neorhizobium galegae]MCQ1849296.1 hypothetical protein [Neorhizobium galegae]